MFPMADNEPVPTPRTPTPTSNQVNTTDLKVTPLADSAQPDRLYPQGSSPVAAAPAPVEATQAQVDSEHANKGAGAEGEETVWEGRYSLKNFLGRIAFRALLTVAWIVLAAFTWGYGHEDIWVLTALAGPPPTELAWFLRGDWPYYRPGGDRGDRAGPVLLN